MPRCAGGGNVVMALNGVANDFSRNRGPAVQGVETLFGLDFVYIPLLRKD